MADAQKPVMKTLRKRKDNFITLIIISVLLFHSFIEKQKRYFNHAIQLQLICSIAKL